MAMGTLLKGFRGSRPTSSAAEAAHAPPEAPQPAPGTHELLSNLAAVFETSGAGWFWQSDAEGHLSYIGEPLTKALELSAQDLLGKRVSDICISGEGGEGASRRNLKLLMAGHKPCLLYTSDAADE